MNALRIVLLGTVLSAAALAVLCAAPRPAAADPADAAPDAAPDASSDAAGEDQAASDAGQGAPLACDGALCDTSNGATCAVSLPGRPGATEIAAFAALGAALLVLRRRRARVAVFAAGALLAARDAQADERPSPVDVVIREPPPPHRFLTIEWNPLPLFTIDKLSANVVVTPGDHHALVLSPFYVSTSTAPVAVFDDSSLITNQPVAVLPKQTFTGFGTEIGYRYYVGAGGPRGFFVGPSFILGSFTAKAQNGTETPYLDLGVAGDVGYQMLVADRVVVALGAGVQYTATTKSIPDQQFPAQLYANDLFRPRVLGSLGWAF